MRVVYSHSGQINPSGDLGRCQHFVCTWQMLSFYASLPVLGKPRTKKNRINARDCSSLELGFHQVVINNRKGKYKELNHAHAKLKDLF